MSTRPNPATSVNDKKWQPSTDQRRVLEELNYLVKQEKSGADFARLYCDFGYSKLSKILAALDPGRDSSYFDDVADAGSELESIELLIDEVKLQKVQVARRQAQPVLALSQFRAVAHAVRECRSKNNPERIVKYLAPTGGGKTMLCNYLAETLNARIVEVRTDWKKKHYIVLQDLAKAIGLRTGNLGYNTNRIENRLIEAGNERQITLALDEGEFFGSAALNSIKLLLNKARFTFVICAIPDAHDKWNDYYVHESDQIARRTHAQVVLSNISPGDCELFFGEKAFEERDAAVAMICEAASQFGHYSLVNRVVEALKGVSRAALNDVAKAVQSARRQMLRSARK